MGVWCVFVGNEGVAGGKVCWGSRNVCWGLVGCMCSGVGGVWCVWGVC